MSTTPAFTARGRGCEMTPPVGARVVDGLRDRWLKYSLDRLVYTGEVVFDRAVLFLAGERTDYPLIGR